MSIFDEFAADTTSEGTGFASGFVGDGNSEGSEDGMKWHRYVVGLLCGVGAIGNALTVIVLSRHRGVRRAHNDQETAVYCGMVAMAVADTLYCLATLPRGFIPDNTIAFPDGRPRLQLAYQLYSTGLISTSAMVGSWLVVTTAGIRYIGICHPFRARAFVNFRSTVTAIVSITVTCIVFNLPSFWVFDVLVIPNGRPLPTSNSCNFSDVIVQSVNSNNFNVSESSQNGEQSSLHLVDLGLFSHQTTVGYAFLWIHAVVGLFVPLTLLIYFNVCLINALRLSEQFTDRYTGSRENGRETASTYVAAAMKASCRMTSTFGTDPQRDGRLQVMLNPPKAVWTALPSSSKRLDDNGGFCNYRSRRSPTSTDATAGIRGGVMTSTPRPRDRPTDMSPPRFGRMTSGVNPDSPVGGIPLHGFSRPKISLSHVQRRTVTAAKKYLTVLLILIVLFFLVLVFPSDLLDFASHLYKVVGGSNPESLIAARSVTNILQVANYSLNFLLYVALNARFRSAMLEFCRRTNRATPPPTNQQGHRSSIGSQIRYSDVMWSSSMKPQVNSDRSKPQPFYGLRNLST